MQDFLNRINSLPLTQYNFDNTFSGNDWEVRFTFDFDSSWVANTPVICKIVVIHNGYKAAEAWTDTEQTLDAARTTYFLMLNEFTKRKFDADEEGQEAARKLFYK